MAVASPRRQHAQALFAPLGPTYDRYASLLSFGQDPRWRRFLVSRTQAGPADTVLDVATGTGAVAAELIRRKRCTVVGLDQSPEMLAQARRRLPAGVRLVEGDADHLPFPDASFAALTFTYLMRYVDDPGATLAELARVVRPGGTIAALEFGVPPNPAVRALWRLYVGVGLPLAGRLISPGWREVGDFLGPSIEQLWARLPLDRLLELWRAAGIEDVRSRRLSLGGGIIVWGHVARRAPRELARTEGTATAREACRAIEPPGARGAREPPSPSNFAPQQPPGAVPARSVAAAKTSWQN